MLDMNRSRMIPTRVNILVHDVETSDMTIPNQEHLHSLKQSQKLFKITLGFYIHVIYLYIDWQENLGA